MPDAKTPEDPEYLTPKEFREWLAQEVRDSAKGFELRVIEANALVAAYTAGEITAEEAEKRLNRYNRRWGEALYGAYATPGVTDQNILEQIDNARALNEPTARGHVQRQLKRTPPESER